MAKSYFANLATILSCTINITAPSSECQVYFPRPSSLNSFTNSTLELIFDSLKFDEDNLEGFEHHYGGKLVTFLSAEVASTFTSQFPVDIVVRKKTHHFHLGPPPTIHSGVQVQVMGLPCPFSPEQLKLLGQSLALKPTHLVYCELLHSCRGKPTDKGLLIFSVCPFSLLVAKTMALGGYDIQFSFLTHCHLCGHIGHSPDFCHVTHMTKLPTIYFDDKGNPSLSPPKLEDKKKGKEKAKGEFKNPLNNKDKEDGSNNTATTVAVLKTFKGASGTRGKKG